MNPNQLVVFDLTKRQKTVLLGSVDGSLYQGPHWADNERLVYQKGKVDNGRANFDSIDVFDLKKQTVRKIVVLEDLLLDDGYRIAGVTPDGKRLVYGRIDPTTYGHLSPRRGSVFRSVRSAPIPSTQAANLSAFAATGSDSELTEQLEELISRGGTAQTFHPIAVTRRAFPQATSEDEGNRAPSTLQLRSFKPKVPTPQLGQVWHGTPSEPVGEATDGCVAALEQALNIYSSWDLPEGGIPTKEQVQQITNLATQILEARQRGESAADQLGQLRSLLREWNIGDFGLGNGVCWNTPLYLYSQEPVKVTVKVGRPVFNANLPYQDGWSVFALPNGTMITSAGLLDKITYDYAAPVTIPSEGYVVPRTQLTDLLTTYATTLGLNPRESSDFISHWEKTVPTTYPYIFVSHYQGKEAQEILPLDIEPKPDTLLQVVMIFKPLSTLYTLPSKPILPFPPRAGFTAVEWSGVVIE
jgi:hypothetical protein